MQIPKLYSIFRAHRSVSTDTRTIRSGDLFFALRGPRFDGNRFALKALEAGASYAVVDDPALSVEKACIVVENTLDTLQQLAAYHRAQYNIPFIGITGTNGKTTTKELLHSVLREGYSVHYTQGNLNNHIGVPRTLLALPDHAEIAIIEMGANHQGEIATLCAIANPTHGLITNIGKAHLEGFGSLEGVVKTKRELFDHLAQRQGTIFYNADDERLSADLPKTPIVSYTAERSLRGRLEARFDDATLQIAYETETERISIRSALFGTYNALNIAAAITIGEYFELTAAQIRKGIERYEPSNHRSQIIQRGAYRVVMDAYNANPTSMRESIESFAQLESDKKGLILGDMLELGVYAKDEHQAMVDWILTKPWAFVYLVGKHFGCCRIPDHWQWFEDVQALRSRTKTRTIPDGHVLIKGSRSIRLEDVLGAL